ncbi:MAG: hypothetical protein ACLUNS_07685 [Alistipes shahii]
MGCGFGACMGCSAAKPNTATNASARRGRY